MKARKPKGRTARIGVLGFPSSGKTALFYSLVNTQPRASQLEGWTLRPGGSDSMDYLARLRHQGDWRGTPEDQELEWFRVFQAVRKTFGVVLPLSLRFDLLMPDVPGELIDKLALDEKSVSADEGLRADQLLSQLATCDALICVVDPAELKPGRAQRRDVVLSMSNILRKVHERSTKIGQRSMRVNLVLTKADSLWDGPSAERVKLPESRSRWRAAHGGVPEAMVCEDGFCEFALGPVEDLSGGRRLEAEALAWDFINVKYPALSEAFWSASEWPGWTVHAYLTSSWGHDLDRTADGAAHVPTRDEVAPDGIFLPLLGTLEHLTGARAMRTWSRRGLVAALLLGLFHFLLGAGSPQTLAWVVDGLLSFGSTDAAAAVVSTGLDLPTIELVRAGEPSRMRPLRDAAWDVAKAASEELSNVPDVGAVRQVNQLYDRAIELSEELGGDGVEALQAERDSIVLSNLRQKVESGLAADSLQLLAGLIGGVKATPDTLDVIGRCVEEGGRQIRASATQIAVRVNQVDREQDECEGELAGLMDQLVELRKVTRAFRSSALFDGGLEADELEQLGRPFGVGEASADLAEAIHSLCSAVLNDGEAKSPEAERLANVARTAAVRLADADLIREVQEQVIVPIAKATLDEPMDRLGGGSRRLSQVLSQEGDNPRLIREARERVMQVVTAQPGATQEVREVMANAVGAAIRQIHETVDGVDWGSPAGQEFVQELESDLTALEPFLPWVGLEAAQDAIGQYAKCRLAVAQTGQQGAVPSSAVLNAALEREIQRSLVLPESDVEEWQIGEEIYTYRLTLIDQYRSHLIQLIETATAARIAQHTRALRDALGPNAGLLNGPLTVAEAHAEAMRMDVSPELQEGLLGAMRASSGEGNGLEVVKASLLRLARSSRTSGLSLEVASRLLRESGASLLERRELCEEVFMAAHGTGLAGQQVPLCAFLQAIGEDGDRGLIRRVIEPLLEATASFDLESCFEAQPGLQEELVSALGTSVTDLMEPYMAPLIESLVRGAEVPSPALIAAHRHAVTLDAKEHVAALEELDEYLVGLQDVRQACLTTGNELVLLSNANSRSDAVWALQMPLTLQFLKALASQVPSERRDLIWSLSFDYRDSTRILKVTSLIPDAAYLELWGGISTLGDNGWELTSETALIGCSKEDVLRILASVGAAVLPSMPEALRLPGRGEYDLMARTPGFLTGTDKGLRDWVNQGAPVEVGKCWQTRVDSRRPVSSSFRFVLPIVPPLMRQFQ